MRRAVGDEFEDGVGSERVVVVLVFVTGEDAEDAHTDHVDEGVVDEIGIAGIVEGLGELVGQADAMVELPQRQQSGVRGQGGVGGLDMDGQRREKIEVEERSSLYIHDGLACRRKGLVR